MRFQFIQELVQGYKLTSGDRAPATLEGAKFCRCCFLLWKSSRKRKVREERLPDELRAGPVFRLSDRLDVLRHSAGQGDCQKGSGGFVLSHCYYELLQKQLCAAYRRVKLCHQFPALDSPDNSNNIERSPPAAFVDGRHMF